MPTDTTNSDNTNPASSFDDIRENYIKAIKFFQKHSRELEQVRRLLDGRLTQLAFAYTHENRIPTESIIVRTRVKSFESFLQKSQMLNIREFTYPSDALYDLVGARVICWFLDDCRGIMNCISNSNFLTVQEKGIFNYIDHPKESGYRGIHLHVKIAYDTMSTANCQVKLAQERILCEIQVRTKLMDAWADLTHEFHYKSKTMGMQDEHLEKMLEAQAKRLYSEDESFVAIRNLYQKMLTAGRDSGKS